MTLETQLRSHRSLMPLKAFAKLIGLHYQTVYGYVREGHLPVIRIGHLIKIDPHQAADWIRDRSAL